MTVRVGVIGVGMIGADHVRRIRTVLSGGAVVAVSDVDPDRAALVAAGATVHADGAGLIADPAVDAVLVASWGPTHAGYVLAGLAAGKPVFCEKPLATTQDDCLAVLAAEVAAGRRLVQVGFMRRYDAAYRAVKAVLDAGTIGPPTLFHSVHRNASVPPHYTADMAITDTAVHDVDVSRWLLGDEIAAVTVLRGRRSGRAPGTLHDPLLLVLETAGGVLVDVEVAVTVGYGYDIRGEVVGETGTVELAPPADVVVRSAGARVAAVAPDWQQRFRAAYDVELQAWLDAVAAGTCVGPSTWDGYAATAVADAGMQSLRSAARVPVTLVPRPELYGGREWTG
ncbi:MAG TPA: Gfo/Idh/MocA family oxidoreductase [Mycobacteriales bacterium]|nr:Gfo/Idh/MocA family oxidoreductase [Mycobacteriales bacterium]